MRQSTMTASSQQAVMFSCAFRANGSLKFSSETAQSVDVDTSTPLQTIEVSLPDGLFHS